MQGSTVRGTQRLHPTQRVGAGFRCNSLHCSAEVAENVSRLSRGRAKSHLSRNHSRDVDSALLLAAPDDCGDFRTLLKARTMQSFVGESDVSLCVRFGIDGHGRDAKYGMSGIRRTAISRGWY